MSKPLSWVLFVLSVTVLGLVACSHQQVFSLELPPGVEPFDEPTYNPSTAAGFELGKKLFYDPILSGSNTVSCATCHLQQFAFSDGVALHKSTISGNQLGRHVPTLINVGWAEGLFWDGGVPNLEFLMQAPIEHPDEMAQNLMQLEKELNAHTEYPQLFKEAFKAETVSFPDVSNALSQFVRGLQSFNSPYDRYRKGEANALSALQKEGHKVYERACASCHTEGLFTDNAFHNNGIDSVFDFDTLLDSYKGRFRITLDSADLGLYKTPTLRNVTVSAPYMHDGRFKSLSEVVAHYSHGVNKSPTLDEDLKLGSGRLGVVLTTEEKVALEAFLESLTDRSFLENAKLAPDYP